MSVLHHPSPEDESAVRAACLDYVEGFLTSDAGRVESGVHPGLVKKAIRENGFIEMDRPALIRAATSRQWPQSPVTVEIHEIYGNIATAAIRSRFVDFVQLAKLEGKWQVVHVIWAMNDPTA